MHQQVVWDRQALYKACQTSPTPHNIRPKTVRITEPSFFDLIAY